MTVFVSFRECKHRTGTCSSLTTCCWWPSKSEYRDNDTCSINEFIDVQSNFKLKKLANSFRSSTTFKLKHRIRVCELWLATCIYDVSEATLPPDKSFVLGWPVTNVVATFKSVELKELWLNKLNE